MDGEGSSARRWARCAEPARKLANMSRICRIRDASGVYRAFYVAHLADSIVIFHAFAKKTQKTPPRDIELGKRRLKEMLL